MEEHSLPLLFLLAGGIFYVQSSPTGQELQLLIRREVKLSESMRSKREAQNQPSALYSVLHSGSRVKRAATTSLSSAEQAELLDLHNDLRASISATDMKKMEWNDALAANAQTFADQCSLVHGLSINPGGFTFVNQNTDISYTAVGTKTLEEVFEVWEGTSSSYTYSTNTCSTPGACGPYLQLVWADTQYVGCGQKECTSGITFSAGTLPPATITICHYAEGGNNPNQLPYTEGDNCTACPEGFSCEASTTLCIEDPCASGPCQNGGQCSPEDDGGFSCTCPSGYTGATCENVETVFLICQTMPCQNGATCNDLPGGAFTCQCPAAFTGFFCQTAFPCGPAPCMNGGTCMESTDGTTYTCSCPAEFTGSDCETLIPCSDSPCQNGGTCTDSADFSSYDCDCPSEYTGQDCETFIPCSDDPCQNGGESGEYCTSEDGEVCFLSQSMTDDFDWTRRNSATPSGFTGPDSGANGTDYFLYIEATGQNEGDVARLESTDYCFDDDHRCIAFYYHMFGIGTGTLRVLLRNVITGVEEEEFSLSGNQGNEWVLTGLEIDSMEDKEVIFEAVCGSDHRSDIAIDQIRVVPGSCGCISEPCARGRCIFQYGGFICRCPAGYTGSDCTIVTSRELKCLFYNPCTWFVDSETDDFDWSRSGKFPTPTANTGPSAFPTGWYGYLESSGRSPGDSAVLTTEGNGVTFDNRVRCLSFRYHMFGDDIGTLSIYAGNEVTPIWSESGNQGDVWISDAVTLPAMENLWVRIEGTVGTGSIAGDVQGDIAIDNVIITDGACP